MEKKNYYNSVTAQVEDLKNLAKLQADKCFDLEKLAKIIDRETASKLKRVMLTGCGDSYSAAGAMVLAFKKLSGLKKCNSPDIMDFSYYYSEKKILKSFTKEEVLFAAISFSGGSERLSVALKKAESFGVHTMMITNNPESTGAKAAQLVFNVETPAGCNTPGLRSYYASMVAITALGAYVGLCNGNISEAEFYETKASVTEYTLKFMEEFERIDDLMFSEALRMKDLNKFELIADGNEGYSAQFVEEKFIECGGVYCDHTTSEEFAHISYFFRCPDEYGTIVMINEDDKSLSRMKDTINGCLGQQRPTLIVTDATEDIFGKLNENPDVPNIYNIADAGYNSMEHMGTPTVCRIPKAPKQWLSPLVDFIPGALLAGYQAAVNEHNFFGGNYDFRTQTWKR